MKLFLKTFTAFAAIIFLFIANSAKIDSNKKIPSCIQDKIKEIQSGYASNSPGSILQYEYNGHTVYYIPPRCCDIPSQLFDSNCKLICNPDGGFTGKGDGKCPDFFSNRKDGKLIWQDDRK